MKPPETHLWYLSFEMTFQETVLRKNGEAEPIEPRAVGLASQKRTFSGDMETVVFLANLACGASISLARVVEPKWREMIISLIDQLEEKA